MPSWGGGRPFHFSVILRPPSSARLDEGLVRTIIEQEKPAFCTYELAILPATDREGNRLESDSVPPDRAAVP